MTNEQVDKLRSLVASILEKRQKSSRLWEDAGEMEHQARQVDQEINAARLEIGKMLDQAKAFHGEPVFVQDPAFGFALIRPFGGDTTVDRLTPAYAVGEES